ncbi:MAG: PspC domain-containing protein [Alteromonadaceae bacterium]|nr:PspC domain-containing protein [Alteromonadaceae bacterium]
MNYQREYNYRENHSADKKEQGLSKNKRYKKLSGVCAGIAKHYCFPRLGVRIATVSVFLLFPMAVAIAYLLATIILPNTEY